MTVKMFVWANPYHIRYGTSAFFAVAETVDEARELAQRSKAYAYVEFGGKQFDASSVVLGEPTRILDVPCGEWHDWSE